MYCECVRGFFGVGEVGVCCIRPPQKLNYRKGSEGTIGRRFMRIDEDKTKLFPVLYLRLSAQIRGQWFLRGFSRLFDSRDRNLHLHPLLTVDVVDAGHQRRFARRYQSLLSLFDEPQYRSSEL